MVAGQVQNRRQGMLKVEVKPRPARGLTSGGDSARPWWRLGTEIGEAGGKVHLSQRRVGKRWRSRSRGRATVRGAPSHGGSEMKNQWPNQVRGLIHFCRGSFFLNPVPIQVEGCYVWSFYRHYEQFQHLIAFSHAAALNATFFIQA